MINTQGHGQESQLEVRYGLDILLFSLVDSNVNGKIRCLRPWLFLVFLADSLLHFIENQPAQEIYEIYVWLMNLKGLIILPANISLETPGYLPAKMKTKMNLQPR